MKKSLLTLGLVISMMIPAVANAQKVACKIKGSDTCLPLSQKFAEVYNKNNPGSDEQYHRYCPSFTEDENG